MFRKILIFAMFATAAGYCFASDSLPQQVTSEVFTDTQTEVVETQEVAGQAQQVPTWPLAGSEADVEVGCKNGLCSKTKLDDNIKIVSKIGSDLIVENNFNLGVRGDFAGWSGGANMLHGNQIPTGFDDDCKNGAEMPLLTREMLEDDGGTVLAVARSSHNDCGENYYSDGYNSFMAKMAIRDPEIKNEMVKMKSGSSAKYLMAGSGVAGTVGLADGLAGTGASFDAGNVVTQSEEFAWSGQEEREQQLAMAGQAAVGEFGLDIEATEDGLTVVANEEEFDVNITADAEPPVLLVDQVRSWVVANGQTLREVLQDWCNKEGWDLVWATSREYPIEASAVFKGRFVDVASALVRNFGRATPIPYAKFYKGNRVLVISTSEE